MDTDVEEALRALDERTRATDELVRLVSADLVELRTAIVNGGFEVAPAPLTPAEIDHWRATPHGFQGQKWGPCPLCVQPEANAIHPQPGETVAAGTPGAPDIQRGPMSREEVQGG